MFAPRVAYKSLDGILRRKIVKGGKSMFTPIRVPKFNVQAMYSSKIEGAKQFALNPDCPPLGWNPSKVPGGRIFYGGDRALQRLKDSWMGPGKRFAETIMGQSMEFAKQPDGTYNGFRAPTNKDGRGGVVQANLEGYLRLPKSRNMLDFWKGSRLNASKYINIHPEMHKIEDVSSGPQSIPITKGNSGEKL
jgi:hypothetical protein